MVAAAPAGPVTEGDTSATYSAPAGVPDALVAILRVLNRMLQAPSGVPEEASDKGGCVSGTGIDAELGTEGAGGTGVGLGI
jgi:hypothetical protein